MNYFLLLISAIFNGLKSVYAKKGNSFMTEKHNIYTYNSYMFIIAFISTLVFGIPAFNGISIYTVTVGAIYGFCLYFSQLFLIKAMNEGNTSITTLFYSCGFLGPTFVSVFLYNEKITPLQITGIILILVSFVITVEGKGKTSLKWLIFVFSALICNAFAGSCQKIFGMSDYKPEQSAFMITVFLTGSIVSLFFVPKHKFSLPSKGFIKTSSASGITLGLVNNLNVYLAKVLPGSIAFPCVNSGGIIFSALIARIMIKEKLSVKKLIGVVIGITAICIIAV